MGRGDWAVKEVGRTDCSNQANRTNRTNQTNQTNLTNPIDYYLLTPIRPISLIRPICPISLIRPICPIILITSIKSISIKQQYYVKIHTYSFKTLRRKPHG